MTLFTEVYNRFLGQITDDMYIELTPTDTLRDLQNLLIAALPRFEFPRKNLFDYVINTEEKELQSVGSNDFIISSDTDTGMATVDNSYFAEDLTNEEIAILATLMNIEWLKRQISSIEHIRMKYSGVDFKMTSQANHLQKLITLRDELRRQDTHEQRLYKRRCTGEDGKYKSNWSVLREVSTFDY